LARTCDRLPVDYKNIKSMHPISNKKDYNAIYAQLILPQMDSVGQNVTEQSSYRCKQDLIMYNNRGSNKLLQNVLKQKGALHLTLPR